MLHRASINVSRTSRIQGTVVSQCTRRRAGTWARLPRAPRIMALALMGAGAFGISIGIYKYSQIPPSPYPQEVTKHLRKALYYEGAGNDPKEAISCYLQALEKAADLGMDQTSDDMTGLKIKIGTVYEKVGRLDSAIRVYSGILTELKSAIQSMETNDRERVRLIRRALGTSVKVGDLSSTLPNYADRAEVAYTWALETMLKENIRHKGDSSWLEDEAAGGLYESAANHYYSTGKPQLALPLFLKALECIKQSTCHSITLMNNIASSISCQNPSDQVQTNASLWAVKARDLKVEMADAEDQGECDLGRCMAMFNLATIYEKQFKHDEAIVQYKAAQQQALRVRSNEASEVISLSKQGLQRIEKHQR